MPNSHRIIRYGDCHLSRRIIGEPLIYPHHCRNDKAIEQPAPEDLNDVLAYRISGPLFFAAADKLFADLHDKTVHTDHEIKHIVLQCDAVTVLDTGAFMHSLTLYSICCHINKSTCAICSSNP